MTIRKRVALPMLLAGTVLVLATGCTSSKETSELRSQVMTAEEASKAAQAAAEAAAKSAQDAARSAQEAAKSAQAAASAAEKAAADANAAADKADRIFRAAQRK